MVKVTRFELAKANANGVTAHRNTPTLPHQHIIDTGGWD
ncbi:hypothetical protein PQE70_gp267 [Bacillus phage vB_BanS_Nate]|uniref:Uncharacterized protein n=1 Tax=Bacillus phage vB_BanS_Nate TaxID=2894788 RepID=A0AAE9CEH9_9CAUD|nr:hypothetical protein PQE70_gp267 [Bacillus phage vB_BanS_Nate]UGO51091.1 hypothetical protein NATE_247 [Bacillus phage vB_BanS_Nate]